jgi:hypothetical protein
MKAPRGTPKDEWVDQEAQRSTYQMSMPGQSSNLHAGLVGLLQQIPGAGGWTVERRDNFLRAFTAVLDFSVPVVAAESPVHAWSSRDEDDGHEEVGA